MNLVNLRLKKIHQIYINQSFGVSLTSMTPVITVVPLYLHLTEKAKFPFSFQTLISKLSPGKTCPANLQCTLFILVGSLFSKCSTKVLVMIPFVAKP
jgi:hypothetical protein